MAKKWDGTKKNWERVKKLRKLGEVPNWAFGEYVCTDCNYMVRNRDKKAHERWHLTQLITVEKKTTRENVVAQRERDERRRRQSQTVAREQARRGRPQTPQTPQPTESVQTRARRSWAQKINEKGQTVAEKQPPPTGGRVHPHGPAGYIQAAARMLIDFQPLSHTEQKELALSMNAVLGELAQAVEAYQENRVRERFHPNCIRPLDLVTSGLMEIRSGWVHMILAIERHYSAHFEAARQGGPVPGQQQGQPTYFDEAAG